MAKGQKYAERRSLSLRPAGHLIEDYSWDGLHDPNWQTENTSSMLQKSRERSGCVVIGRVGDGPANSTLRFDPFSSLPHYCRSSLPSPPPKLSRICFLFCLCAGVFFVCWCLFFKVQKNMFSMKLKGDRMSQMWHLGRVRVSPWTFLEVNRNLVYHNTRKSPACKKQQ